MADTMRKMGPLAAEHPAVNTTPCPGCHQPFKAGDYVTLVPIGPGADPETRRKWREGQACTAVAVPVHWACATGEEE